MRLFKSTLFYAHYAVCTLCRTLAHSLQARAPADGQEWVGPAGERQYGKVPESVRQRTVLGVFTPVTQSVGLKGSPQTPSVVPHDVVAGSSLPGRRRLYV